LQLERERGRLYGHDPAGEGAEDPGVTELMDLFCNRGRHPVAVDVPKTLDVTPEPLLFFKWQRLPKTLGLRPQHVDNRPPITAEGLLLLDGIAQLVQEQPDPSIALLQARGLDHRGGLWAAQVASRQEAVA